jgi:hypothetical protein
MTKRPLVEDCIELDINRLNRLGYLRHGIPSAATIGWGKFTVRCEHDGRSSLTLRYPDGRSQRLMVVRIPQYLGGHRWMFHLGTRHAVKLYMPPGGDLFRSRAAWGLDWRCRHLSVRRRREERVNKLLMRMGPVFDHFRPHGMWRSKWERKVVELELLRHKARNYGRNERQQERIKSKRLEGAT